MTSINFDQVLHIFLLVSSPLLFTLNKQVLYKKFLFKPPCFEKANACWAIVPGLCKSNITNISWNVSSFNSSDKTTLETDGDD